MEQTRHFGLDISAEKEQCFVPPPEDFEALHLTNATLGRGAKEGERYDERYSDNTACKRLGPTIG